MPSRMVADSFDTYALGTLPTTLWTQETGRILPTVVSVSTDGLFGPHSGSKMMRCRYDGTIPLSDANNFQTCIINPDAYANNEYLFRVWIRVDANFDIQTDASGAHLLRQVTDTPHTEFVDGQSSNSTIMGVWVNGPLLANVFSGRLTAGSGWVKFERYINYTTGTAREWKNGTLLVDLTGVNFAGSRFGELHLTSNWGDPSPDATNDIYFDDFELFTDRTTGSAITGLMSDATAQVGSGGGDTTPPTDPANLSATPVSTSQINLSWTASTDAVGVTNYLVERALGAGSFAQIGTSVTATYSSTGLAESTTYRYQVRATDAAGNLSAYSNIATQATLSLPPAAPTNLRFA